MPWPEIAMTILGLVSHFLKDLMQHRLDGEPMTPTQYYLGHPYQSLLTIAGAAGGFVALWETGQMTLAAAYLLGFAADSAASIPGRRRPDEDH